MDFDALSADVHRAWLRDRLVDAMADLSDDGRRVVQLCAVEGWELPVVAEMMGCSETEARDLYREALRSLRASLGGRP